MVTSCYLINLLFFYRSIIVKYNDAKKWLAIVEYSIAEGMGRCLLNGKQKSSHKSELVLLPITF